MQSSIASITQEIRFTSSDQILFIRQYSNRRLSIRRTIMKTFSSLAIACLALDTVTTTTNAYSTNANANANNPAPSRRAFFQKAAVTAAAASAAVLLPVTAAQAAALDACPAKSQNCIRTTWTPPEGTSQAKMAAAVKDVLTAYPQEGQSKVDLGGWVIVEDGLENGGTSARVEYKSGLGNFAKFLNGNKPFVDDLKIEITDKTVELRSSSRIGESDLGVNQKRLVYMANAIKAMGWEAAEPKY
jgi:hypothetical protein